MQVRAEGQELIISGPSSVDTEHFRKNHLPNLAKQLEAFRFSAFHLSGRESDDALTEQEVARFEQENEKIFQAANEETLRAMESLAQMAAATRG